MKFSVIIPAQNEEGSLAATVEGVLTAFRETGIELEILIVNDNSRDGTAALAETLARRHSQVRFYHRSSPPGFGLAVRDGIARVQGDAVMIVMADASDDPQDMIAYARKIQEGYDCVFGSRFIPGGGVENYPTHKLILNRLANWFIQLLFLTRHNDITNTFKAYRREVIEASQPLISKRFNITVELPLKALIRGYKIATLPIRWYGRKTGMSKLVIHEMGSRYLFSILYVWLQKHLLKGDY